MFGFLNGAYNALLFKMNMTSLEPLRGKAYHEDLRWRMVYQREMLGLSYQQIASNLNVHTSTVWRTVKRFEEEGRIDKRKNEGPRKLTESEEFAIMEIVLEKPSVYLREIVRHIQDQTGTIVHESTICCVLKCNNFSHKRLSNIARQRNVQQRAEFQAECELYSPEMLIFVDETGCDRRDAMRKFGYSLRGTYNVMEHTSSTVRVSLIAGMDYGVEWWNVLWNGL